MICWSCERAAGDGATCGFCDAIQPPDQKADYFDVMGVPASYALDLAAAEARFRELSRRFHPDRFVKAETRARRASLQRSVQLNEAWRAIKDPVRRAEYLLRRAGYDIGGEQGPPSPVGPTSGDANRGAGVARPGIDVPGGDQATRGQVPVPAALLGEILELREDLADARGAGDDARVQVMAGEVRARVDSALRRVADGLSQTERNHVDPARSFEAVARELIAIRYFRRFLEEVAVHDEVVAAGAEATTHA